MSNYLEVIWARTHNLKNINIKIPKNKITVFTGVSWSWKSSLAFNTIYNVGQQKYLESLSSYARMFIGWLKEEAKVSEINWLSPTISIDQKTTIKNPRSTVGTITEIYDYYKLLFLNIGKRKCINCTTYLQKDAIEDIINHIKKYNINDKFIIKSKINKSFTDKEELKKYILSQGFIRFEVNKQTYTINDDLTIDKLDDIYIIIDRLVVSDYNNIDNVNRLKDSLNIAYNIWEGILTIGIIWKKDKNFSCIFICNNCLHKPKQLSLSSFSFNSHNWACSDCHWLWIKKEFIEDKIINYNLTLLEWAIRAPGFWWDYYLALIEVVWKINNINLNTNYSLLSDDEKNIVLYGTWSKMYKISFINESGLKKTYKTRFEGVLNTLKRRFYETQSDKGLYDDFMFNTNCLKCEWSGLNKESLSVFVNDVNINFLSNLNVVNSIKFLNNLKLTKNEKFLSTKILKNAIERLEFLKGVWLTYMTISRKSSTLSWWESQRIRLATQIGTKLEGIIYVLDEPSIWLHARDNYLLIQNLKKLRDIWNTLIVVEHDEEIMKEADYIVDIWPKAWKNWWEIVAKWTMKEIINDKKSITAPYLKGKTINIKRETRPSFTNQLKNKKTLNIFWAKENNLKNIDIQIPLSNFVVVSGVSWSWKSSLVNNIIAKYLLNKLNKAKKQVWIVDKINGTTNLDKLVLIDQSPIWKTPRSNPATYTGVFTHIREVYWMTNDAQTRGYKPWRFSFNTKQWRCNVCDWDWVKKVEMHFLPPIYIQCESCCGKRFNNETLSIKYKWKTIADILDMSITEGLVFFNNHPKIKKILNILDKVGLWYIKLWQSSTTLSWWEAQRIKLSTELSKRSTGKTIYILDEPTTGLHFQDIEKLLKILHSLVDKWNSVIVIEHNLDVIKNADYIIDIWPEWWDKWWKIIYEWNIEQLKKCKNSYTWKFLK